MIYVFLHHPEHLSVTAALVESGDEFRLINPKSNVSQPSDATGVWAIDEQLIEGWDCERVDLPVEVPSQSVAESVGDGDSDGAPEDDD